MNSYWWPRGVRGGNHATCFAKICLLCRHVCLPVLGPAVLNIASRHLRRRRRRRALANGNASRSKKVFGVIYGQRRKEGRNERILYILPTLPPLLRVASSWETHHRFTFSFPRSNLSVMRTLLRPKRAWKGLFQRNIISFNC